MRTLRSKLSYANVVASLALFIALGGSAVAVSSKINGSQIQNHSITGVKLKQHVIGQQQVKKKLVVNRARTAQTAKKAQVAELAEAAEVASQVDKLVVTSSTGPATISARAGAATASATRSKSGSLVSMSVGEVGVELLNSPPFKFSASCTDSGGGKYKIDDFVTSTEENWLVGGPFPSVHPAGEQVLIASMEYAKPILLAEQSVVVSGPSGASLLVNPSLGLHVNGADCVVNQYAIG